MRKRFKEEQIIRILGEASDEVSIREVCRRHNITEQTFFRWRNKYGGMDVSDARRLKSLEEENRRLKKLVADQALSLAVLKDVSEGNF